MEIIGVIVAGIIIGLLGNIVALSTRNNLPLWLTIICGLSGAIIGWLSYYSRFVNPTPGIDWIRWLITVVAAAILMVIAAIVARSRANGYPAKATALSTPINLPLWLTIICSLSGTIIGEFSYASRFVNHTSGIDWIRWLITIVAAATLMVIANAIVARSSANDYPAKATALSTRINLPLWLTIICGLSGDIIGEFSYYSRFVNKTPGIDWIRWLITIVAAAILMVIANAIVARSRGKRSPPEETPDAEASVQARELVMVGGRYELGELLGRGGMAEVRLAVDQRLGRSVAVKQLRTDLAIDPTFQARFRREAQSAAGLNHPTIVAVYDTGEEIDPLTGVAIPYIVMELVEGPTLRDVLREGRKILPERALELTQGVLDALSYSHKAGIVHRDIKPANVMLTPNGGVKVMDFGIARAVADTSATMTQTAAVIGTAQYLSPEQARGDTVDARSDLYSTGCLLYELLLGRPPFVGDSPVSVAYQHVREAPVPPSQLDPEITPEIDAVVLKALAKDPADRYQSALEMKADITRLLSGQRPTTLLEVLALGTAPPQLSAARYATSPNADLGRPKAFISYARWDQEAAQRLAGDLKSAGIDVWIDTERLRPGERWRAAVTAAIERSEYFIAILSSRSVTHRGYVQSELREALDILRQVPESETFLIPVRLDDVALNPDLRELTWVDLFPDWTTGVSRLIAGLGAGSSDSEY